MNARREFLAEAPLDPELAGIQDWGLVPVLTRPALTCFAPALLVLAFSCVS